MVKRRDRGAAALIVAILVSTGTLIACAALTVDLGNWNAERRTLQNSADSVALGLAYDCATAGACSASTASTTLANVNAGPDQMTSISRIDGGNAVCGTFTGLPACTAPTGAGLLGECPSTPASSVKYARVFTQTQTKSGGTTSSSLPFSFGQLISGQTGVTQQTCATVGETGLSSADKSFPMVIALCAWNYGTSNGTKFAAEPPYTPAPNLTGKGTVPNVPSTLQPFAVKLITHVGGGNNDPTACDKSTSGQFTAGGFGWTETTDANTCATNFTLSDGQWQAPVDNGASVPKGCKKSTLQPFVGTTVYVPIITGVSGNNYILSGLAAFYVAGYRVPGDNFDAYNQPSNPEFPLKSPEVGVWGWFTAPIKPVEGSGGGGGTNRGPLQLSMLG